MTPLDAWLIACAFVGFLIVLTALLEQPGRGRRFTERAIRWVVR
jgi:hypothetical protein